VESPKSIAAHERSRIRLVGAVLSILGLVIFAFAAAAGIGGPGLVMGIALAGAGLTFWLVGILEDRLIEVRAALKS
jgi:hypothetical protein